MSSNGDSMFNGHPLSKVPFDFPFPYNTYEIQENFMKNLYFTLENSKFGIFESPTGTGKSLSLICGILKWYYDHKVFNLEKIEREISELEIQKNKNVSEDWIEQQSHELKLRNQIDSLKDCVKREKTYDEYIDNIRKQNEKRKKALKQDQNQVAVHALTYRNKSDTKTEKDKQKEKPLCEENLENVIEKVEEFDKYMKQIGEDKDMLLDDVTQDEEAIDEIEETEEEYEDLKIFFCSRTHSQLSQFVKEINKTVYQNQLRITSLSSRQNYCINESVNRLKNINLINEKCIELGRNSKKTKVDENKRALKKTKKYQHKMPLQE
uniref:Probable ATP-dependent DNA helicase DDX11 n=1 Tax=Cacopsylla melanoneura TaxID=428564 RepID=A0A8D9AKJ8_9HEMI